SSNAGTVYQELLQRSPGSPRIALQALLDQWVVGRTILAETGTDLDLNTRTLVERCDLSAATPILDSHTTSAAFQLLASNQLGEGRILAVGSAQYYAARGRMTNVRFLLTDEDVAPSSEAYPPLIGGMERSFWEQSRYILACRCDSMDPDRTAWCGR